MTRGKLFLIEEVRRLIRESCADSNAYDAWARYNEIMADLDELEANIRTLSPPCACGGREPITVPGEAEHGAFKWHMERLRATLQDSATFLGLALTNINALIQEGQSLETSLASDATQP